MKIVLSIIMLIYFSPFYGQDIKQKINAIKKSRDYINAEVTGSNREETLSMAMIEFASEVNSSVFGLPHPLSAQELKVITKSLEIKRGENVRVFVYASFIDILDLVAPIRNDSTISEQDSTISIKESQVSNATPNCRAEESTLSTQSHYLIEINEQVGKVTSVFSRMNTFTEIKSLLRQYKGEGKITNFNWVSTRDISPEVTVVVFKEEKIVAILLQEKNGKRINYLTNKEDSISNYRGCRAIWYKEK
jgi:hypothetical protein